MNEIAVCFSRMRQDERAAEYFRRAVLIDDTFAPALVNFAIHLNDNYRSEEAEEYLLRAQHIAPGDPHIDGVLGAIRMLHGRSREASDVQLSAWLKSFDKQEFAHSYLFNYGFSSEHDVSAAAAEHIFWGRTLAAEEVRDAEFDAYLKSNLDLGHRKIRIGYLSSDLRKHSVRFFFRPLLEGHDRTKCEIYAYYDMAWEDEQTIAIRDRCDVFREIANLPDSEVVRIIRQDRLDVLVELAGHTSITRIHLLKNRMARVQMTALGYPPTTGLENIDYKVVDLQAAPLGTEHLYAEKLLRLPDTFWCFNPLEDTPDPSEPPSTRNGYITFGCYGNIAKISRRVLVCWARILEQLPSSRIVLKAISFQDEGSKTSIRSWIESSGIDLSRVELVNPDPPERLYDAYAEVDVILDTMPFNGGTTSCFALWMGVPVVTLSGDALISRMGASMLHALDLEELIASNDDEYVSAALRLAMDSDRLGWLRRNLRGMMLSSSLSNGKLFAGQFEKKCVDALMECSPGSDVVDSRIDLPVLPEDEILRRASYVLRTKNFSAVERILDYCKSAYPASVGERILRSSLMELNGDLEGALACLSQAYTDSRGDTRAYGLCVNAMRVELKLSNYDSVLGWAESCSALGPDAAALAHMELYEAAARAWSGGLSVPGGGDLAVERITFIVHCEGGDRRADIATNIGMVMAGGIYELVFIEGDSWIGQFEEAIRAVNEGVVVLMKKDASLLNQGAAQELMEAIQNYDVVGVAGSARLQGLKWFDAGFDHVYGAMVVPSNDCPGCYELSVYGPSGSRFRGGVVVLDGVFIAARKEVFESISFDSGLQGSQYLSRLDWVWRAHEHGYRIGVAPRIGLMKRGEAAEAGSVWVECARRFNEKFGLSPMLEAEVVAGASVLLPEVEYAQVVINELYGGVCSET
ncbi:MAG: hypothetical protein LPJ91_05880 [Pseudazoarcus pumilus]|nr:hypothetical protein [Pseudazoarcus pumilus]